LYCNLSTRVPNGHGILHQARNIQYNVVKGFK
jgi:hypothetical protein